MNVLLISSTDYPSGAASAAHAKLVVQGIRASGEKAYLLILNATHLKAKNSRTSGHIDGVPYFYAGGTLRSRNFFVAAMETVRAGWRVAFRIIRRKVRGCPDVVLLYDRKFFHVFPIFLVCRLMKVPLFAWLVELDSTGFEGRAHGLKEAATRLGVRCYEKAIPFCATALVVISTALERFYKRTVPQERILLWPIMVNPNVTYGPYTEADLPAWIRGIKSKKPIVYSGTFAEKDGLSYILDSFASVASVIEDAVLVLTGAPITLDRDTILKGVEEQMRRLGISDRVVMPGFIPRKELEIINSMAAVLLACRSASPFAHHGFPWKLGEYCMYGRPILATRVSDVELYFKDRENLYICTPEDVNEMASQLIYILKNHEEAISVAAKGRQVAISRFNYVDEAGALIRFINRWA